MSDILFQAGEGEQFSCQHFFQNPYFAEGLNRIELSNVFSLTPNQLFEELREVATKRFNFELPDQKKLQCLQTALQKQSLLRDICKCLGVQIKGRSFMLSNNIKQAVSFFND